MIRPRDGAKGSSNTPKMRISRRSPPWVRSPRLNLPRRGSHGKEPGQNIQRIGLSTLNDILNVVAPPISEHEVIQIWLSHDMQGYDGVESVVYKAFAKVRACLGFLSGVALRGS